jgi:hypothetical protein
VVAFACNGGGRAPGPDATAAVLPRADDDAPAVDAQADADAGSATDEATPALCARACAASAAVGCPQEPPGCADRCGTTTEAICPPETRAMLRCLAAQPPEAFACRNGRAEILPARCKDEAAALRACALAR